MSYFENNFNNQKGKNYDKKKKKYWLYIALVLAILLHADMPAQLMHGYENNFKYRVK